MDSKLDEMIVQDYIDYIQDCVNETTEQWWEYACETYEVDITPEDLDYLYQRYFYSIAFWFLKDVSAYQFSEMKQKGFKIGGV